MLICKADESKEILFANEQCAELFGYESIPSFLGVVKSFHTLVIPEDQEKLNHSIEMLNESQEQYLLNYHVLCKDGKEKHILNAGRLVDNEHFGLIFYSFLFDFDRIMEEIQKDAE